MKYPDLDITTNIWKRKKAEKRERDLNWVENVKIESRYLKLCSECRAVIRCMKAAFYRPDYQKLLMCPLIRRLGREFISKHATEPLKRSAKLLKHSAELLEHSVELSRVQEKTKSLAENLESSAECLKSSSVCLYYNRTHAVPINHRSYYRPPQFVFCHCELTQYPKNIHLDTSE